MKRHPLRPLFLGYGMGFAAAGASMALFGASAPAAALIAWLGGCAAALTLAALRVALAPADAAPAAADDEAAALEAATLAWERDRVADMVGARRSRADAA